MKCLSVWKTVLVVASGTLVLGCGGGDDSDTGSLPDFGNDVMQEVSVDTPMEDPGGQTDPGKTEVMDDPGTIDDPGQVDDPGMETGKDPGPGEVETDPGIPPVKECPCDDTLKAKVCGIDEMDYENDQCAKCAICKDDPVDCVGCTGAKDCDPLDPLGPNGWIKWKECCACCPCDEDVECQDKFFMNAPCGPFCDKNATEWATACEMKKDYDCAEDYDLSVDYLGACK